MADYPITAVTRRKVFSGSAGVGPYAFTFPILVQTDIVVYKNSTLLTLTTDYTVTINGTNGTGSVTLVSPATASDTITIIGARAIQRTTDFVTAGDLAASSLNEQLDANIIMTQQLAEENKRTLKAPPYDPEAVADGGTLNMTLPAKADRAGKILGFDANGNPSANAINLPTTLTALNYVRANSGATAYELRAPASVRSDIGADNASNLTSGTVADARLPSTMNAKTLTNVTISSGSISGITDLAIADGGTGASTASAARSNLGLGTIATQDANNVAITGGTIADVSAVTVVANTATDALRITQTGAGNALVVEDETNPDTTPFQINASGQVSIGTTTASGRLNIYHPTTATVNLSGDSATAINSTRYSSDTTTTNIQMRKARGTLASPTAVNSGDGTGILIYNAYGGTNFRQIATIAAPVDTYTSDTNISGLMTFATNPGGTAVTEKMRITAAGDVGIGTSAPSGLLHVSTSNVRVRFTNTLTTTTTLLSGADSGSAFTGTETNAPFYFITNNTERMRIDSSGTVQIGTLTSAGKLTVYDATTASTVVQGDSATNVTIQRSSTDTAQSNLFLHKSRGTVASPTAVASADTVGAVSYRAYGGSNYRPIANINGVVDTYTSDTNISGFLTFNTNSGGTAVTERMRIDSAGTVQIGTTTSAGKLTVYDAASASLVVQGDSTTNFNLTRSSTDTSQASFLFNKTRGTVASPTAVASGDITGNLAYRAYGGTNYRTIAQIIGTVDTYTSDTSISGYLAFNTNPGTTPTERMRITAAGNVGIGTSAPLNKLDVTGSFGRGAPVTKTGDFTLAATENWVICNGTGSITVTFPAASSWTGREVMIKTIAAQTVVSASSNVVPRNSATAGTAILGAAAGNWATLVSDGTNWVIMAGS